MARTLTFFLMRIVILRPVSSTLILNILFICSSSRDTCFYKSSLSSGSNKSSLCFVNETNWFLRGIFNQPPASISHQMWTYSLWCIQKYSLPQVFRTRTREPLVLFQPTILDRLVLAMYHRREEALKWSIILPPPVVQAFRPVFRLFDQKSPGWCRGRFYRGCWQ